MQELQLKGFKSVFCLLHLLPPHHCHIHSGGDHDYHDSHANHHDDDAQHHDISGSS